MKVKEILKNCTVWMPGKNYEESMPVVSVLLPTYARAEDGYFERAVQSVLNQRLKNIELIIIDDCSVDGTFDLIQYFMKVDGRVSCIQHQYNVGLPAISEYEGYMKARGEYIAFIFDDNEWQLDYLDKTISLMIRKNIKASFGLFRSYYNEKDYVSLPALETNKDLLNLYAGNFIANGGVVLHKEVIENIGLYDPHVILTRVCDWDLWLRVLPVYTFEFTNIYAGDEFGTRLKNSLGNSIDMNYWCNIEHIRIERNADLLPENFKEFDIYGTYPKSTRLYCDNILFASQRYNKKVWYTPVTDLLCSYSGGKKRIIIYSHDMDATINLAFIRLANNDDFILRFIYEPYLTAHDLLFADALICVRNSIIAEWHINLCKRLGIKVFYYVDDNFKVLVEEFEDKSLIMLADSWNYITFNDFQAILVSTIALQNYLLNNLHQNVILVEPVIGCQYRKCSPLNSTSITVAFLGGNFRVPVLLRNVVPALERLQKQNGIIVTMLIHEQVKESFDCIEKLNINIISIPYSNSLDQTLLRYSQYQPDLLIHCGPDLKNNIYKTENALMNAVQIGAVLLASNVQPYDDTTQNLYVTSENSEMSWYSALLSLVQNSARRIEIYENARNYCVQRYNCGEITSILIDALKEVSVSSNADLIRRFELIHSNGLGSGIIQRKTSRPLNATKLVFSKLIENEIKYRIQCNVDHWSEFGICLDSFGQPYGKVEISIYHKKNLLRQSILQLEDCKKDGWTYISFKPIDNSLGKKYMIVLKFFYRKDSSKMGVFEDGHRRTFLYKVVNKLGFHIPGMNTLFVDCRAGE